MMADGTSNEGQTTISKEFSVPVHPGYSVLPPILPTRVNDFWIKLREHLNEERSKPYETHGNQRTSNKVVRIFVSSTFTDFFNERESLVKKVFTALRDEMTPFGIQIIDCDLRWGVSICMCSIVSEKVYSFVKRLGAERFND